MSNISLGHIHITLKNLPFLEVHYVDVTCIRKIFKFEIWPGENKWTVKDKIKFCIKWYIVSLSAIFTLLWKHWVLVTVHYVDLMLRRKIFKFEIWPGKNELPVWNKIKLSFKWSIVSLPAIFTLLCKDCFLS